MRTFRHFLICFGLLSSVAGMAAPADEVIVVYNKKVPESKEVADHYVKARNIPSRQVFGFNLSTSEEMTRTEFSESLQRPLAKLLEDRKLWKIGEQTLSGTNGRPAMTRKAVVQSQIRYAVLCYGVPVKIAKDPAVREPETDQLKLELQRNEAAVDSELALLPAFHQKLPVTGPLSNPAYGTTNTALLHPTNGILMVARLDAPSAEIALRLVDKAMDAERDGFWGRAYFDLRKSDDPGYKMGDDWIRTSAEIARRVGFETVVDENGATFPAAFPLSQVAYYMGWYDENVSGPFTQEKVEFMPGAFAYHLHSFSAGTLRTTARHWVGPLLAKGATATMGCVDEPYLAGTPELGTFTARFLYLGFSFGESAYASQPVLSWQTTVIGDPLYRPFLKPPDQMHEHLLKTHSPLLAWSQLRLLNLNLANGKSIPECLPLIENLGITKESAVLTEKLAALYAAQGKPSSAVATYLKALKLEPSPQQEIRLHLVLGQLLAELDRAPEGLEQYEQLLKNAPTYPDKSVIYSKMATLARKAGKPDAAEKYQAQSTQTNLSR